MTDGFPVPGEVFEGRYRVSQLIGSGGFARVYYAVQEDLGRDVAIKILMPASTSDGDHYSEKIVRRFNQEARLVSRLRDPHTITMFDYGETDNGLLYMVFEYIEGRSLSQIVHEDGALSADRVAKVLEATLSSLQEAHAFGVLHRDIKPGNIMLFDYLGRPDQVKLLDFGIAKSTSEKVPGKDITADGALVGTPRYMSPEQIRGKELGAASDIYSLGLVAFEMLTGYKAIESNSSVTVIGRQLDAEPFRVPEDNGCPRDLRNIVNRMMSKSLEERYATAEEALEDLKTWRSGGTIGSSSPPQPSDDKPVFDDTDRSLELDPKRSNAKYIAIAVACLLLVGAIIAMLSLGSGEDPSAAEPPEKVAGTGSESDELALQDDVPGDAEPQEEAAEVEPAEPVMPVEETRSILIATTPRMAAISINGTEHGQSPVQVDLAVSAFPIEIVADIDGKTVAQTLETHEEKVLVDVSSLLEPPKKTTKRVARTPRKKPKKSPKSTGGQKTKKSDSLTLPALDL